VSQIKIQHPHNKSRDELKAEIQKLGDRLQQQFGARYQWVGDSNAEVSAPGVNGKISFDDSQVSIEVKLGFVAAMMKSKIEGEIRNYLDKHLPLV